MAVSVEIEKFVEALDYFRRVKCTCQVHRDIEELFSTPRCWECPECEGMAIVAYKYVEDGRTPFPIANGKGWLTCSELSDDEVNELEINKLMKGYVDDEDESVLIQEMKRLGARVKQDLRIRASIPEPAVQPEQQEEQVIEMATATALTEEQKKFELEQTKAFPNVEIRREVGTHIIVLPDGMAYKTARVWLQKIEESEDKIIEVNEEVHAFPFEGAYAFSKALDRMYGFYEKLTTPGFFRDTPPAMVSLPVGVGKSVQVPWGRIAVPDMEGGFLQTSVQYDGNRPIFAVYAKIKQKDKARFLNIMDLTREIAKKESLYKGHAIKMKFPYVDKGEEWNPGYTPTFVDVSYVKLEELVLRREDERLVQTTLLTPIKYTAACRKHQVPLKRGVLLEGSYGVGKTLTANVVAHTAAKNGWTFIFLDCVDQLQEAIVFARNYQPAVIFAEDIDRVTDGERDKDMDSILNTIDGADSKNSEIMVVLTTNAVSSINKAMVRPGRIDAVISVRAPDAEAAERLVRLYARDSLIAGTDLTRVSKQLEGQIPAVIREIVERSKLAAIGRQGDEGNTNETIRITAEDLEISAHGMLSHLELMKNQGADTPNPAEAFTQHLAAATAKVLKNGAETAPQN